MWHESAWMAECLQSLLSLWQDGVLRPLIHAAVPAENAAEAHQILHDRKNIGKVVLTFAR